MDAFSGFSFEDEALSRRERKRRLFRRSLAIAAMDLFREKGFAATTVEDIAERALCSPSTFFRYAGSKENVIFYDLPDLLEQLDALEGRRQWRQIRFYCLAAAKFFMTSDREFQLAKIHLCHEEPVLYTRYLEIACQFEDRIAQLLHDPDRDPLAIEARAAAGAIVAACRTAFYTVWAHGGDLREHLEAAFIAIEGGFPLLSTRQRDDDGGSGFVPAAEAEGS